MKSPDKGETQCAHFSLKATRSFLVLLSILYFIVPSLISRFIFDDSSYVYVDEYQRLGDYLSITFGLILIAWLYLLIPRQISRSGPFFLRVADSPLLRVAYYLFIVYLVVLVIYGMKLRMGGGSRLDLLGGEDNFLLPGMGYLLITAAVYCVRARSPVNLTILVVLCVLVDAVFAGKIFSFLAVGMLFFRLDYSNVDSRRMRRIFLGTAFVGFVSIFALGIARTYLAGEEVGIGLLALVYLTFSEFIGVQATVGWAIAYHFGRLPTDLLHFAATLQDTYFSTIGYGLALSPVAYFIGNFGFWGVPIAILTLIVVALFVWEVRRRLRWVVFLIVILNFQHFLRHGVNVFAEKLLTDSAYFLILDQIALGIRVVSKSANSERSVEARMG